MPGEEASGRTVYLHVGEPKTGTTYLQQVLWANRDRLRQEGLLVPGKRPVSHWAAAQDLRQVPQPPNDPFGPYQGAWDRLAQRAARAPRIAVISHELLAAASREQAARGIASLAPAEVHVILTVRDMQSLLPAEWQETIKHRNTRAWQDWLADVVDRESGAPNRRQYWFWQVHDTMEILRVWGADLAPERVHVITVPQRGAPPDLLWRRFAGVIGVDPGAVDLGLARRNVSLAVPEIEFLRRLNAALPDHVPNWFYMRNVKQTLAHGALAERASVAGRLELPSERRPWAREHAEKLIAELAASGYDIVGNLDELLPPEARDSAAQPEKVPTGEILDAAVAAATALLEELGKTQGVTPSPPAPAAAAPAAETHPDGGLKRRLVALSERSVAMHRARRTYWHLANAARQFKAAARPGPSVDGD